MRQAIFIALILFGVADLFSQQLYLEAFAGRNLSNYNTEPYSTANDWHLSYGGRLAFGADHFQIGGEYSQYLNSSTFTIQDVATGQDAGTHQFATTFYGGFFRTKICKYPTSRFGVTVMAGAGLFDTERKSDIPGERASLTYGSTLGYNGGIGISIPVVQAVMIELGYHYYLVNYKETTELPELKGHYHSLQAGLSLNFVFGKRAAKYREIRRR